MLWTYLLTVSSPKSNSLWSQIFLLLLRCGQQSEWKWLLHRRLPHRQIHWKHPPRGWSIPGRRRCKRSSGRSIFLLNCFAAGAVVQNSYVINLLQKWVLKSTCHNATTIKDEALSCFDKLLFSWLLMSCIIWKGSCLLSSLPPLHRKQLLVVLLHLPWTFFCLLSYQKAFCGNENFSWMLDWSPGLMITVLYLCEVSTLQACTERRNLFNSVSCASYWQ